MNEPVLVKLTRKELVEVRHYADLLVAFCQSAGDGYVDRTYYRVNFNRRAEAFEHIKNRYAFSKLIGDFGWFSGFSSVQAYFDSCGKPHVACVNIRHSKFPMLKLYDYQDEEYPIVLARQTGIRNRARIVGWAWPQDIQKHGWQGKFCKALRQNRLRPIEKLISELT